MRSALMTPSLPASACGVTVVASDQTVTRSPRFAPVSTALAPFVPRSTVAYIGTATVSWRLSLRRVSGHGEAQRVFTRSRSDSSRTEMTMPESVSEATVPGGA